MAQSIKSSSQLLTEDICAILSSQMWEGPCMLVTGTILFVRNIQTVNLAIVWILKNVIGEVVMILIWMPTLECSNVIIYHKRPLSYSGDHAVSRLREEMMSGSSVLMLETLLTSTQVVLVEYSWLSILSSSSPLWRSWCWKPSWPLHRWSLAPTSISSSPASSFTPWLPVSCFCWSWWWCHCIDNESSKKYAMHSMYPKDIWTQLSFPQTQLLSLWWVWTTTVSLTSPSTGCWFSI